MYPTIGGNTRTASVTIHTIIVTGDNNSIFTSTAEAIQCRCRRQIPYKPMRLMQP